LGWGRCAGGGRGPDTPFGDSSFDALLAS
jgi:hypothetical protein